MNRVILASPESDDPALLEFVRTALSYEPLTGYLIWKYDWSWGRSHKIAGKIVTERKDGYIRKTRLVGCDHRKFPAHRLIWFWMTGFWPNIIDHVNGDSLDNRWLNLRDVDAQVNAQNRRVALKGSKSGYLGVKPEGKRFAASIKVNGEQLILGYFDDPEEAHEVYVKAKRVHHEGCTI